MARTALAEHTREGGHGLFFLPLERPRHNPDHARTYTKAGLARLVEEPLAKLHVAPYQLMVLARKARPAHDEREPRAQSAA